MIEVKTNEKGNFVFAGLDTVELAKKYGTPLYIMDESKIRDRMILYKKSMNRFFENDSNILYASKALSCKEMYRIANEEGIFVDVVSLGELYTAKFAGFDLNKVFFHGNNKTDFDLEMAVKEEVGEIVVDSFDELEALNNIAVSLNKKQHILIRVTPNIDPHTQKAISTGELDSKFGIPIETGDAERAISVALEKSNIILDGFHSHIGSLTFDVQPFIDQSLVIAKFMKLVKDKFNYESCIINFGGGFGVPYVEDDPEFDIESSIKSISDYFNLYCRDFKLKKPTVFFEPGRSIVADSGITLYTVGTVKRIVNVRTYVSVDGGMTDNPRYALYGSKYECLIANKADSDKNLLCNVVGRCCESGDIIGENLKIQNCSRGDILAVLVTGAYNYSMASNYNRIPRPAMIFIKDGKDRLVIKRETIEDLYKNDI